VRRYHEDVALVFVLVGVAAECDLEHDRGAGRILSLDEFVCDVERGVGVDERRNVPPR
jgi:hypothetical protein